jgi:hypothetical protein
MSLASAVVTGVLRVFLDCSNEGCHEEYLREEVELGEYVRDRTDADVHVLVTRAQTGAGGEEYTLAFIGLARFDGTTRTLRVTTEASDSEDQVRRRLESALTLGLLTFLAPDTVPSGLEVTAALATPTSPALTADNDPWRRWIFSLNGNMNLDSEESTSERNWGLSAGADRITPEWKLTIGTEWNESHEEFELDDEDDGEQLSVTRKDWSINWLGVKSLGEHWSAGLTGHLRSSTFDNTERDLRLAPALEWNFFPYSMYTRRQFRVLYAVGGSRTSYYEETLFGRIRENRARQELSATYEQREPWGTLEGRVEASNYFPGFENHRLEVDGEVSVRVARGLSLNLEASGSRIRDQLSLPRRNASAEEVLLRLRQLLSGFEARFEFGLEYRFGSRFAAIVNPRFGQ